MHIKTVNTKGGYQCVIVEHNNPIRVDRREGYGVIYWVGLFMSAFRMDSIYLSLNYGGSQELLMLALCLWFMVVKRAAQYIVYGFFGLTDPLPIDRESVGNSTVTS